VVSRILPRWFPTVAGAAEARDGLLEDQVRVRVVRPLRDVGMKECQVWAWWCGLRVVGRNRYIGGRQGIGALTHGVSRFIL
jgi:hypothetical protein